MRRIGVWLSVMAVAFVGMAVVGIAPALAQSKSKVCANGFPEWANQAFAPRHGGAPVCEPASGKAAKYVPPQAAVPKAAYQQRPQPATAAKAAPAKVEEASTAASTPVAKAEPAATSSSGGSASAGTGSAATTSAKPQCRRYLASTGQTVEVPCS